MDCFAREAALMSPTSSNPERTVRRRNTVRILNKRRISREAALSLWLAAGAGAVVFGVWWFSASAEPIARPLERTLTDTELDWRCEDGHTFVAAGQPGERLCLQCDQAAFPVSDYSCPVHGPFRASVQFSEVSGRTARIDRLRLTGRDWVSAETGLHCPRCGRPLEHLRRDPVIDLDQLNMP